MRVNPLLMSLRSGRAPARAGAAQVPDESHFRPSRGIGGRGHVNFALHCPLHTIFDHANTIAFDAGEVLTERRTCGVGGAAASTGSSRKKVPRLASPWRSHNRWLPELFLKAAICVASDDDTEKSV